MTNRNLRVPAIELAISRSPGRPYASHDYQQGVYQVNRREALQLAHMQFNPGDHCSIMAFDVDRRGGAFAWEKPNLPPPTWSTTNPANGKAHLVWVLERPVLRCTEARRPPVRLLRAIRAKMGGLLGADSGYPGFITRNPLSDEWITTSVNKAYTLTELMEYLPALTETSVQCAATTAPCAGSNNHGAFTELRTFGYRNWSLIVSEVKQMGSSPTLESYAAGLQEFVDGGGRGWLANTVFRIENWLVAHHNPAAMNHTREHQQRAQAKAAVVKRRSAEERIKAAIAQLRAEGRPINQSTVSVRRGVHRSSINKNYKSLLVLV